MAKIMKTSAQEEALQTIIGNLKLTERLNAVMDNVEILEAGTITVQADKDKVAMELPAAVLNKLLGDVRKAKVAEVKTLSKRYSITLDDEDEKILAEATAKKSAPVATPVPEVAQGTVILSGEPNEESEAEMADGEDLLPQ
ncbi:hypothetical protein DXD54_08400 [Clostridium sp. TM06-18]|nr:hypothetical protein [Clostridium sp. TM06-18]RHU37201.1 hypothetical protein DXD54_08400 [Clostridium sp. TM06-18]